MSFSDQTENSLLTYLFDTLETSTWLALFDGSPTDDGTGGTEVSGGGYARQSIPGWSAASGGTRTISGAITFPTATDAWGDVTHFGIYDAVSAGNLVAWGTFAAPLTIAAGATPQITSGDLAVNLD